jgi:2-amino-4-hydroxy-6-hydroxymethyldihydropteridine diphosphokinase
MPPAPSIRPTAVPAAPTAVLIGLGSNRSHGRHGRPPGVVRAAITALAAGGLAIRKSSPILETAPLGPSNRRYANAAVLADWAGSPLQLLALLKRTEADFGRRRGQRWGARVLDCDLLAFAHETVRGPDLTVPHARLHERLFVLDPLLALWPDWRHPRLNLRVRHLAARLRRPRPVDCSG